MMISVIGSRKKGFTLIEIMVSIAILSMGLILILQGFTYSINIFNIAQSNLEAVLLAEENMVKFEMGSKRVGDSSYKDTSGNTKLNNMNFAWDIRMSPQEEYEDLYKISSIISWNRGQNRGSTPLVSYLRIPPDENK
jgi:prepilin-type N-terminal cleavage/methylation domain-containing protein